MKVVVIGSGQASISAIRALVRRGIKPIVLDAGEELAGDALTIRDRLRDRSPHEWDNGDVNRAIINNSITSTSVPRKLLYGSDYFYAKSSDTLPLKTIDNDVSQSLARGGFSVGWGGAMLPASDIDLYDWPVKTADLAPHYRAVLRDIPLSAQDDGLNSEFPNFKDNCRPIRLDAQAQGLLDDLKRSEQFRSRQSSDRIVFGQARETIWADDVAGNSKKCIYCGICISGCPYGAIYTAEDGLKELIRKNAIDYRPGVIARSIQEVGDRVIVNYEPLSGGGSQTETFSYAFIGAGVIGTARILLQSFNFFDVPLTLKESSKFALPFLRLAHSPIQWPNTNTLAGVFIEALFPDISPRWLHIQVSSTNELILQKLHALSGRKVNIWGKLLSPIIGRLMVAYCGLHSDHSHQIQLRLVRGDQNKHSILEATKIESNDTSRIITTLARRIVRAGLSFRALFFLNMIRHWPAGLTAHYGATFPMRLTPRQPYDTDRLGRPFNCKRVYIVDSSVFPSIPGTTVALLIMANAHRIASEAAFD